MHDTHISVDVQRITLNALCMTISGGGTEQQFSIMSELKVFFDINICGIDI